MKSQHVSQIECDVLGKIIGWVWRTWEGKDGTRCKGRRVNTSKMESKESPFDWQEVVLSEFIFNKKNEILHSLARFYLLENWANPSLYLWIKSTLHTYERRQGMIFEHLIEYYYLSTHFDISLIEGNKDIDASTKIFYCILCVGVFWSSRLLLSNEGTEKPLDLRQTLQT